MARNDSLSELDWLTWRAHEADAFVNAWISTWLMMANMATTPEQRMICQYEVEAWSKVRSRVQQATRAEIDRVMRNAYQEE